MRSVRGAAALAATAAAVAVASGVLAGTVAGAQGPSGQAVFGQYCKGCHTIGGGKLVGPDLKGVADLRTRAWVETFVKDPAAMIASGDATAAALKKQYGLVMPTLGLTDAQIAAVVSYLGFGQASTSPGTTTPATPTPTGPTPTGNADRGKQLFEGSVRFGSGGPACLSCHSVAGLGSLGGGKLGPDLTGAYAKYGGTKGLDGVLSAIAFPTMAPVFGTRPLSAAERADLVSFLRTAPAQKRNTGQAALLVALAAGVALLLAILSFLIWHRRLAGVRRPLVDRATRRTA